MLENPPVAQQMDIGNTIGDSVEAQAETPSHPVLTSLVGSLVGFDFPVPLPFARHERVDHPQERRDDLDPRPERRRRHPQDQQLSIEGTPKSGAREILLFYVWFSTLLVDLRSNKQPPICVCCSTIGFEKRG